MRLRRSTPALLSAAVAAGMVVAPSAAVAAPDQELPFVCGEEWTGTTRSGHRPSVSAIDFNRTPDLGRIVVASASGVVSRVADAGSRSYGRWVVIEHTEGWSTLYAHLKAQWVVPGQFVDQGTAIGRVGDTGGVSGAHLHYEQRVGSDVQPPAFHQAPFVFGSTVASGNCPDVPLAGDWNGDRSDEVAVFRRDAGPGTFEMFSPDGTTTPVRLGRGSDSPVAGDWDGDGVTDLGVRRPGNRMFLLRLSDGSLLRTRLGIIKDRPVTGDWDGDGITDVGVWRAGRSRFLLRMPDGTLQRVRLGNAGSQPLTGDWDGNGITDVGVFDAATATFTLRTVTDTGEVASSAVVLGGSEDLAVTGDWDGDGRTDVGTWTPSTATYTLRPTPPDGSARRSSDPAVQRFTFGRPR